MEELRNSNRMLSVQVFVLLLFDVFLHVVDGLLQEESGEQPCSIKWRTCRSIGACFPTLSCDLISNRSTAE